MDRGEKENQITGRELGNTFKGRLKP